MSGMGQLRKSRGSKNGRSALFALSAFAWQTQPGTGLVGSARRRFRRFRSRSTHRSAGRPAPHLCAVAGVD